MPRLPRSPRSSPGAWLLIMVGILTVAGVLVFDHVARMDARFFVRSFPATRALAHYFAGDWRGAAQFYRVDLAQRAAKVPPDQAWSWTTMMRGDLERAAVEAREESRRAPDDPAPRAMVLDPAGPDPHYGLGRIFGKEQRWADALREYEVGYALGGRDIHHVVGLCELYWETGQAARADACLAEVLTRDPDSQRGQALLEHVRAAAPRTSASR